MRRHRGPISRMPIVSVKEPKPKKQATGYLWRPNEALLERLRAFAKRKNRTVTEVISLYVENGLDADESEEKLTEKRGSKK